MVTRHCGLVVKTILILSLFAHVTCNRNKRKKGVDRIVSLSPSLTQIAFAIGLGENIVAVTRYDFRPEKVKKLPKVGGFLDIDVERLLSFNPDLVLLTEMHSPIKRQLRKVGIPTLELRTRSIKEVLSSIRKLGEYGKRTKQAGNIIKKLKKSLMKRECSSKPRVLITLGRNKGTLRNLVGAAKGTYFYEMITLAGGVNVLNIEAASYPRLSIEELVGLKPEVVLDITEAGFSDSPWKSVPFYKNPRVVILSNPQISTPGVHMDKILQIIHKAICIK